MLSEPNKALCSEKGYICDRNSVINVFRSSGFVCVEFDLCVVISCYVSSNVGASRLEEVLSDMQHQINSEKPTIVAGDLNSKSPLWGSPVKDTRGRIVADWLAQNGLVVANIGDEPTFMRRESSSYLDSSHFLYSKYCSAYSRLESPHSSQPKTYRITAPYSIQLWKRKL